MNSKESKKLVAIVPARKLMLVPIVLILIGIILGVTLVTASSRIGPNAVQDIDSAWSNESNIDDDDSGDGCYGSTAQNSKKLRCYQYSGTADTEYIKIRAKSAGTPSEWDAAKLKMEVYIDDSKYGGAEWTMTTSYVWYSFSFQQNELDFSTVDIYIWRSNSGTARSLRVDCVLIEYT